MEQYPDRKHKALDAATNDVLAKATQSAILVEFLETEAEQLLTDVQAANRSSEG